MSSTAARGRSGRCRASARSPTSWSSTAATRTTPAVVKEAASSESIPLARSLAAARLAISELSVTLDGSCLGPTLTGTQVLALELAGELARRDDVRLRVTVPRSIGATASAMLDALGVERMWHDEVDDDTVPTDVVHRPYQVTTPQDLLLLGRLGRRVVLTQQDSIAYHNPAYFDDHAEFRGYRELTRLGLAFADRVVFSSPHALRDARCEDLVDDERARLVPLGIDHRVVVSDTRAGRAARASRAARSCSASAPTSCTRTACSRCGCWRSCASATGSTAGSCSPARAPRSGPRSTRRRRGWARTRGSQTTSSSSASAPRPRRRGSTARPRSCSTRRCSRASASSPTRRPRRACRCCGPRRPRWPTCCPSSWRASSPGTSRRPPCARPS